MTSTLESVPLEDEVVRALSRAAKQVASSTERRNELIRKAHAGGGGVREIARATQLSPASVHNILHGRKRPAGGRAS